MFPWLDTLILIILGYFTYSGYTNGFTKSFILIIQYVTCVLVSYMFYGKLAEFFVKNTAWPNALQVFLKELLSGNAVAKFFANKIALIIVSIISYIILYCAIWLVFKIIIAILEAITELPILHEINALGGVFMGFLKGCLASIIVSSLLFIISIGFPALRDLCNSSPLVNFFNFGSLLNNDLITQYFS
jgi:uncharacterized membrane protein required for colicin V production